MELQSIRVGKSVYLSAIGLLIGLAIVLVAAKDNSALTPGQLADGDVCKAQVERDGPSDLGTRGYAFVLVELADFIEDDDMTKRWRADAMDLRGILSDAEVEFYERATAVSTRAWVPVQGSKAALSDAPVVLDSRTVDDAVAQGETQVIVAIYPFLERNVGDLVLSRDGRSFYSFCGGERFGATVEAALGARPADAERALVAATEVGPPVAESGPTKEDLAQGWRDAEPLDRSYWSASLPPEVDSALLPVEFEFDLPPTWFRDDRTLCLRTEVAWLGCTSLAAVSDDGRLAPLLIRVPREYAWIEVILNDEAGSFRSAAQRLVGVIRPEDMTEDRRVLLRTDAAFERAERASNVDAARLLVAEAIPLD